ncbi:MAG: protein kinase [Planctomycetes bacterium]|nr:protein kinase [Planctomycetota bacterium]
MDHPQSSSAQPFPEIPGYRIEALIGRGSAGVVYRAVQLAVERRVALKVLHPELASRGRAVRRLQREAKTTAKLAHPGIVTAIDMGSTGGLWWYAMELVDGPSLAEKLKRDGAMSEREAVKLFIPLCEALEHAFEQGVVHRDLKPGNILIDSSGRARIVDLGLALNEDDPALTIQGGTLGTPHYISPEQARNPKNADAKSDIWSLGATLFHCVCGRPPFAGASVAEILSGVLYAPVPDPIAFAPELSRNFALVLRKCLTRDPARRYQHPREVREDLERIRERRAVSVKRSSLEPLAGDAERTRRWRLGAALGAALAAACALLVWQPWRGDEMREPASSAVEPFAPLEELAGYLELQGARIAPALERLEEIGPQIPAVHQARADEVRLALRTRFDAQVQAARAQFEATLRALWTERRDFAAALTYLDEGLPNELRTTLGLSARQLSELQARFEVADRRRRVDEDRRVALGVFQQRLAKHFTEVIAFERARTLLEAGRWRAALAALEINAARVVEETKLPTAGFAASDVAAVLSALQSEVIDPAVSELKERWRAEDRRRALELSQLRARLVDEVELGKIDDVDLALDRLYRSALEQGRVQPDEILDAVSDEARKRRDAIKDELRPIELAVRSRVAESLFAEHTKGLESRFRARAFGDIEREFAELARAQALAPVRERVERIAQQAGVLEGVMQRAAGEIERLSQSREELELLVGQITFTGRVEEGLQVFEKGFRFRPSSAAAGVAPTLFVLRELSSGKGTLVGRPALERLAGLAGRALDADHKFELALLRWHLGDRDAAAEIALEAPARADWIPLSHELATQLAGLGEARRQAELQRAQEARLLLTKLRKAFSDGASDSRSQAGWIDELLTKHLDLEFVAAETAWLRERREALRAQIEQDDRARFQRLFGPSELGFVENGAVRLRYVFDPHYEGAFQRNESRPEIEGWISPARSRDQLLDERLWPTLYLVPPLDLDKEMELVVKLEQPVQSGQPRLFSISIAGVHLVFLGAPTLGQKGRWRVGTGTPDDYAQLLTEVLERGRGSEFDGLQKGERHTLRIELKQSRGEVSVWLDDKFLGRDSPVRPANASWGDKSLMFRSLEPVRLLEATLKARYR